MIYGQGVPGNSLMKSSHAAVAVASKSGDGVGVKVDVTVAVTSLVPVGVFVSWGGNVITGRDVSVGVSTGVSSGVSTTCAIGDETAKRKSPTQRIERVNGLYMGCFSFQNLQEKSMCKLREQKKPIIISFIFN